MAGPVRYTEYSRRQKEDEVTPVIDPELQARAYFISVTPQDYTLASVKAEPVRTTTTPVTSQKITREGTPTDKTQYVATYAPKPPPKSLGEQIAEFKPVDLAKSFYVALGFPEERVERAAAPVRNVLESEFMPSGLPGFKGTAPEALGGFVVSAEVLVYTGGSLLGYKNLPAPPTAFGAVTSSGIESILSGKFVKSYEWEEAEKRSPAYLAGTIMGDIALSYLIGKGAGKLYRTAMPKAAQIKLSATKYHVVQSFKQSKVGISASKLSQWLKFKEPVYTLRKAPEKVSTWMAKRGASLESILSWEPDVRPILTGFERAFPSDKILMAGSYRTYGGFELWATVREAHRYAGYPILRPLSAGVSVSLQKGMESWLFEGTQVIPQQVPYVAKELGTWETWSSAAEAHPYAGYPVTYGRVTGVRLVHEPTAFDQIMKGIERGMFAKYGGGLSATQITIFAKPAYDVSGTLKYGRTYGKKGSLHAASVIQDVSYGRKASSDSVLAVFAGSGAKAASYAAQSTQFVNVVAGTKTRQRESSVQVPVMAQPTLSKGELKSVPVEIPFAGTVLGGKEESFDWELEKIKYKPLDFETSKQRAFAFSTPSYVMSQKQKTTLIPTVKLPSTPKTDVPTSLPTPSTPDVPSPDTPTGVPTPDLPSKFPSDSFVASFPRAGGTPSYGFRRGLFGKWTPRTHKIKGWEAMLKEITGPKPKEKSRKKTVFNGFGDVSKVSKAFFGESKRKSKRKKQKRR